MRSIVLPGDMVSDRNNMRTYNTFGERDRRYSKVLGIYDEKARDVIPLEGAWTPRIDDSVVGVVSEVKPKVYILDLAYQGRALLIPGKYDKYELAEGDVVGAMVKDIEGRQTIILKEPEILKSGTIIRIKPKKVPRVIGKKSTMITQIANATQCRIIVGMNGLIWLSGGNVALAIETLLKVEREAHTSGLTDAIKDFLEARNGKR